MAEAWQCCGAAACSGPGLAVALRWAWLCAEQTPQIQGDMPTPNPQPPLNLDHRGTMCLGVHPNPNDTPVYTHTHMCT